MRRDGASLQFSVRGKAHEDSFEFVRVPGMRGLMGVTAITRGQWAAVCGGPIDAVARLLPKTDVSWNDAVAFSTKLSLVASDVLQRRVDFRLPTDAEWRSCFCAGRSKEEILRDATTLVWTARNSGGSVHAVMQLPPNPYGVFDIGGNVFEWCADTLAWGRDTGDGIDRTVKTVRGASFRSPPDEVLAEAGEMAADQSASVLGFRLVASFEL